jgi:hypothetical protein
MPYQEGTVYSNISLLNSAASTGAGTQENVAYNKTLRFEAWGTGAFAVQIQGIGASGIPRTLPVWDITNNTFVGSNNITVAGFYDVDVQAFSNVQANVSAITGISEVASLTVNNAPATSGNVTVTLNGVPTNVAVTIGTAEVSSLNVTGVATTGGNVTVNLNGVAVTVAVALNDTAIQVADKIRATTFAGWATGGSAGTATVTFTSTTVGTKTDAVYDAGTTGATGAMTTTTQGVSADTTTTVATKIRGTSFTGWTTGGSATNVTFTSATDGIKSDAAYSAGTTGATGTMTTTTQGAAPSLSVKGGLIA